MYFHVSTGARWLAGSYDVSAVRWGWQLCFVPCARAVAALASSWSAALTFCNRDQPVASASHDEPTAAIRAHGISDGFTAALRTAAAARVAAAACFMGCRLHPLGLGERYKVLRQSCQRDWAFEGTRTLFTTCTTALVVLMLPLVTCGADATRRLGIKLVSVTSGDERNAALEKRTHSAGGQNVNNELGGSCTAGRISTADRWAQALTAAANQRAAATCKAPRGWATRQRQFLTSDPCW
jgi:hypothetical protein